MTMTKARHIQNFNRSAAVQCMKDEINVIDRTIAAECQDEFGICYPWMSEQMNKLVRQKEAFKESIEYFEERVYNEDESR